MGFFGDFFKGDNDEILFFLLVFLLLFPGNIFDRNYSRIEGDDSDNSPVLFFIILFLLLFFNINWFDNPN